MGRSVIEDLLGHPIIPDGPAMTPAEHKKLTRRAKEVWDRRRVGGGTPNPITPSKGEANRDNLA